MATYAVGDVQGCFSVFERLLRRIDFREGRDRIWLAGDTINRGPRSLDMLRWAYRHRSSVRAVLGNHEIHVLRRAEGLTKKKKRDTCDDLFAAPDGEQLIDWMAMWPFAVRDPKHLMVHAGLLPQWTADEVLERSQRLQLELQNDRKGFLRKWVVAPDTFDGRVFTLVRLVDSDGIPRLVHKGPPHLGPEDQVPWFEHPERASDDVTVIFGHWAALGLHVKPGVVALDSGCVWGNNLSAYRLDDGAVFQEPAKVADFPS